VKLSRPKEAEPPREPELPDGAEPHLKISTARLTLTLPLHTDIDAIHAIIGDPRATVHNPSDLLTSREQAVQLFTHWKEQWRTRGLGYLVIRRHGEKEPLGFCGVKVVRFRDAEVLNLYYRLAPSAWGDGIASEAAAAVVTWAKTQEPTKVIIARVRPENTASARVATKAGLHRAPDLDQEGEDGPDAIYTTTPA
jgi:RimJ/RimL family protein N-acetyltransferase